MSCRTLNLNKLPNIISAGIIDQAIRRFSKLSTFIVMTFLYSYKDRNFYCLKINMYPSKDHNDIRVLLLQPVQVLFSCFYFMIPTMPHFLGLRYKNCLLTHQAWICVDKYNQRLKLSGNQCVLDVIHHWDHQLAA